MSSIYIPLVGSEVTGDILANCLGSLEHYITRIDFTPIKSSSLFDETVEDYVSAFVHFEQSVESTAMMQDIRYCKEQGKPYKHYPFNNYKFWLLLPNKQPIQQTRMNTSQIVENCRLLEKQVADQAAKIEDQAAKIEALTKNLEGVQDVIYQLLGGVYNQHTQAHIINDHMKVLYPGIYPGKHHDMETDPELKSKWNIWPTTRQGDQNEARIQFLERALGVVHYDQTREDQTREDQEDEYFRTTGNLYDEVMSLDESISDTDSDDDEDLSTHSSMPELVDDISNDRDSLTSFSSIGSSERLRNTFELCGNE